MAWHAEACTGLDRAQQAVCPTFWSSLLAGVVVLLGSAWDKDEVHGTTSQLLLPQTPARLLLWQWPSKCGPGTAVSTHENLLAMQILGLLLREKL